MYFSPTSHTFSCLDLAFCSPCLFSDLKWEVLDTSYGSDQKGALIKLILSYQRFVTKTRRWKLQLTKWPLFTENQKLDAVFSLQLSIQELNKRFIEVIFSVEERAIPQSSGIKSKECIEVKKQQNKAWGTSQRYPTYSNLVSFKERCGSKNGSF